MFLFESKEDTEKLRGPLFTGLAPKWFQWPELSEFNLKPGVSGNSGQESCFKQ